MNTRARFAVLACLLTLLLAIAGAPTLVMADSPVVHVVGWGDTLSLIASRYGTTINALMQANNLRNANFVWIGQRLIIPGSSNNPFPPSKAGTYVVQAGDTLFSIATRYGTTVAEVMAANGLYNYWIYVGQVLRIPGQVTVPVPPPAPQGVYYLVRPSDYLSLIAARYGTTAYAIQIANRLPNASFIWAGERLFIPGGVTPVNPPYVPPVSPPFYPVYPPVLPYVPPTATPYNPYAIIPTPIPNPYASSWEAVLIDNTTTAPCYLSVNVVGKTDWPVVVATTDGSFISEPKLTGTKPEKGPYIVEFAHSCTGTWRVIPLGLNIYADVTLIGGHADLEFHPRY